MNDDQMDRLLARPSSGIPPELADKIREQIRSDARPVKPLAAPWVDTLIFAGLFALIGIAFAAKFGFNGWHAQTSVQAGLFLTSLYVLALAGGTMMARTARPGSGRLYGAF